MRIVVFGTGLYYLKRKTELPGETKIIAFLDNCSFIAADEARAKTIIS